MAIPSWYAHHSPYFDDNIDTSFIIDSTLIDAKRAQIKKYYYSDTDQYSIALDDLMASYSNLNFIHWHVIFTHSSIHYCLNFRHYSNHNTFYSLPFSYAHLPMTSTSSSLLISFSKLFQNWLSKFYLNFRNETFLFNLNSPNSNFTPN